MLRRLLTVFALVLVSAAAAVPSSAQTTDGDGSRDNRGFTDGSGVGARAASPGSASEKASSGGAAAGPLTLPVCTYKDLSPADSAVADQMSATGYGAKKGSSPGKWVVKSCFVGDRTIPMVEWSTTPTPTDPAALAQQALNYTALAVPGIGMNPSPDRDQLVNVPTWFWIQPAAWRSVSATASAGGVVVTTTATPKAVVWDPGDGGAPVTCDGPGTAYDPSRPSATPSCSYTYSRPLQRAVVTATLVFGVRWSSNAGGAGDLGVVQRTASVPVRVVESQAINVSISGRN